MFFHVLSVQHFRSYDQKTFRFTQPTTIIVGDNAAGKTSVIEAIAVLSTGGSFRVEEVAEMISLGKEFGRVKGKVERDGENLELEIMLTRGVVDGKAVQSRLYSVNDVRRRKKDFVGNFFSVVF